MKICLINPKYSCGQRAHRIPLGLSYIAAVLRQEGYNVEGYNLDVDPEPDYGKYDVIGVYISTPMVKSAEQVLMKIKNKNVVLGGPHLSSDTSLIKEYDAVGVAGEGEYAFSDIVKHIQKMNYDFSDIPGVFYFDKKKAEFISVPKSKPADINNLPWPMKEAFDHGNYKDKAFAYGAIIASRGCPFKCRNCQPGLSNISHYRVRNPNNVVMEMATSHLKYGVKDFSFEDSELIISKAWTLKFCDEIIQKFNRNGIRVTFQGNARLHQLDDEVLQKLKEAGCRRLGIGVESGSQYVIDNCLNKDIDLKQDLPNLDKIKKYGIESNVWIMIGIPGEKESHIRETINIVKQLDVSTVEINIATPWPGTYFYEDAMEKGWLVEENSKDYDEKRKSVFKTPYLSPERVQELFEEFKKELECAGWVKWSNESNAWAKKPTFKDAAKRAWHKIRMRDVHVSDFIILKNVIKTKVV